LKPGYISDFEELANYFGEKLYPVKPLSWMDFSFLCARKGSDDEE